MDATLEQSSDAAVARENASDSTTDLGTKYLTFLLAEEEYGLEILKVREIIGIMDITRVPQTPEFVRGVINLRGKVIPVIDLRSKFELPLVKYNDQTCIIVVDVGVLMGVIVDTVQEVRNIRREDIEEPPNLGASIDTSFFVGMAKVDGEVKILLDIDRIMTSEELVRLTTIVEH
jgi:purine-binding chemotaxis protein CheW